jgi:hypothetical protein
VGLKELGEERRPPESGDGGFSSLA